MSDIVIEFENRLEDHLDADRLHYSKGLFAKIDKVVSFILTITGILVIAFVRPRWLGFLFFIFAVLEWFNLLSIRPIQIRLSFKNNPKFKEIYRLTFNEDGIHFKTVAIDSKLSWSHYAGLLENDRLFLMIYGKRLYTVIPKSAFKNAEEIDRFRALAKEKLEPSSQGKAPA